MVTLIDSSSFESHLAKLASEEAILNDFRLRSMISNDAIETRENFLMLIALHIHYFGNMQLCIHAATRVTVLTVLPCLSILKSMR
jgi:hypothetical protein